MLRLKEFLAANKIDTPGETRGFFCMSAEVSAGWNPGVLNAQDSFSLFVRQHLRWRRSILAPGQCFLPDIHSHSHAALRLIHPRGKPWYFVYDHIKRKEMKKAFTPSRIGRKPFLNCFAEAGGKNQDEQKHQKQTKEDGITKKDGSMGLFICFTGFTPSHNFQIYSDGHSRLSELNPI